jgi:hypothetical protein
MPHVLTESVGGEIYLYKLCDNFKIWFYKTVIKWRMQCESELWHWVCDKYISLSRIIFKKEKASYVEIKYQLDATDEFLLRILLLAQHVSGTIMPIIRSSRVLYKWFLPVVFGAT